jgi:hypothetical protein
MKQHGIGLDIYRLRNHFIHHPVASALSLFPLFSKFVQSNALQNPKKMNRQRTGVYGKHLLNMKMPSAEMSLSRSDFALGSGR